MGKGTRWGCALGLGALVVGAILVGTSSLALTLTLAKFPAKLFSYNEQAVSERRVERADHTALAREVEAIERSLGTNLSNMPPQEKCFYVEATSTAPILSNERFFPIWRAPANLSLVELYCETVGGTSVLADLAIHHGASPAASVNGSNLSCVPGGSAPQVAFGGQSSIAKGDRLEVALGQVTGSVQSLMFCWVFRATGS